MNYGSATILIYGRFDINKLKKISSAKGISLNRLAEKCGTTRNSFYEWDDGRYCPNHEVMSNILRMLSIKEQDLLDKKYKVIILHNHDKNTKISIKKEHESLNTGMIKKLIEANHISLNKWCMNNNVSRTTFYRWMKEGKLPNSHYLAILAKGLNVDSKDLIITRYKVISLK